MAQVKIYDQETNSYYTVNFLLRQSILDDTLTADLDYYLLITTSLKDEDGSSFPTFRVRTLADVPPGYSTASDFNVLCRDYIEYFTTQSVMAQSSSSEQYSSSSSTEGYSSSSSSEGISSSSSEGYSSSSSSEVYSSSTSSEGYSESSSSGI